MMEKYLMMIFLVLILSACGEVDREEGENQVGRSFFQNTVKRILDIFKNKPAEEETRQNERNQAMLFPKSQKAVAVQNHLSQVLINSQSTPPRPDQIIEKKELEHYRQDYAQAVDLKDKVEALKALVQVDQKYAIPLLKKAYASREPELRKEAILQMRGFNGKKEVVDLLLKALDDPDSDVVMEAVEGLPGLESQRALTGLKRIARSHPDHLVREVAQDYVDQAETRDDEP